MSSVNLYSNILGEIDKFLSKFYNTNIDLGDSLHWSKMYENPIEVADIIGIFADNNEDFDLKMWICFDKDVFINVTSKNVDAIIKYLFERFPY